MTLRQLTFALLLTALPAAAQTNLIANPGFESGLTGWSVLWTRVAGTGTADVVASPAHSGSGALHVRYWGVDDWSIASSQRRGVSPGDLYEYSAWVQAASLVSGAQISVVPRDSAGQVLDWSYGPAAFPSAGSGWTQVRSRFVVPDRAATLEARIIGNDSCEVYVDDVSLVRADSSGISRDFVLENAQVRFVVSVPSFAIAMQDKRDTTVWRAEGSGIIYVQSVDSSAGSYAFRGQFLAGNYPMSVTASLVENSLWLELSADSAAALADDIEFPGPIPSRQGQYLIIPRATGVIWPVTQQYPFWAYSMYSWKSTMAFVGVTDLSSGYLVASDDPWDTDVLFEKPWNGQYYGPRVRLNSAMGRFAHTRTVYLAPFASGGYVSMCNWYRSHVEPKGWARTFSQKQQANPAMARLAGAADIWLLDWSTHRAGFVDTLTAYGIDRAILSLSGSWSTTEPLSRVIDTINARGLLSSRYDIYTDVWPPTHPEEPGYRTEGYPQDIVVRQDSTLQEGWLAYLSGNVPFQGYVACSRTHPDYAQARLTAELDTSHYNCRFIDVELASGLLECYSPTHPVNRKQDAYWRVQLLDKVKNQFNLVTGGEEARDFAFAAVDFGEGTMTMQPATNAGYDWATPATADTAFEKYNVDASIRLPLSQLVYHDVHVATWYTGDGASRVPAYWDRKDALNALYGSMPLLMPPDRAYWNQNLEKFITSYHLVCSIFRETFYSRMTDHVMLTPDWKVQQTRFANGWSVVANCGTSPYVSGTRTIPVDGFYATNGNHEVYRITQGSGSLGVARLADRLFVNPYGQETTVSGLRTAGTALLKVNSDHIALAFVGNQAYVDINPSQLPWPATGFRVFTRDRSVEVTPQAQAGGFLRINKSGSHRFYRLEGDFAAVTPLTRLSGMARPGLAAARGAVVFSLPQAATVRLEVFDMAGRRVLALGGRRPAGTQRVDLRQLASGTYSVVLSVGAEKLTALAPQVR